MKTRTLLLCGLVTGLAPQIIGADSLRLKLEPDREAVLRGSPQEVVIKIELEADRRKSSFRRSPLNLAVVLDRSGSMTGAKIEQARQAAMQLVDRLEPEDIFSLVVYSDHADVLIPAQRADDKEHLKRRIARVMPGGSTALYAGVKSGAAQLGEHLSPKRINRVLLLSDGLANVGPSSTRELRKLGYELAERGIAVTTIGLGEDYNEDLMAGLAEASDANYYYVKDTEKLPEIFAKEFGELISIAAREVHIEVVCPDGIEPIEFIGRSEQFENRKAVVKLSHFTSGQTRSLFLRCRVNDSRPDIATVRVLYRDERADGANRTATSSVRVRLTSDPSVAAKSVRPAVLAEKELVIAAVAKEQALAAADAGNYRQAALTLSKQADLLESRSPGAPAEVQEQIQSEVDNLRARSEQLYKGDYDSSTRKTMQWESYGTRNAKFN